MYSLAPIRVYAWIYSLLIKGRGNFDVTNDFLSSLVSPKLKDLINKEHILKQMCSPY